MNQTNAQKKREIMMIIFLLLILALIILVSKFVIGVNFSLMEHGGYMSIGYNEVRGSEVWTLEFDTFNGTIYAEETFSQNTSRRLLVHSRSAQNLLNLEIQCGDYLEKYTLDGSPLDLTIPGDEDSFKLTLSGTDVLSGYFNAVWE